MKARLIKADKCTKLLCADGTIKNASPSTIKDFFSNFSNASDLTGTDGNWTETCLDMSAYPGEALAYVTDSGQLVVLDENVLKNALVPSKPDLSEYLSVVEYAKKHNRSREMVKVFAKQGRIPGTFMHGRSYFIPKDAPYPVDEVSRKPTSGNKPRKDK